MKTLIKVTVIFTTLLVLFSCQSNKVNKSYPEMKGEIQLISKYGNSYSTITIDEARNAGYSEGDLILVRAGKEKVIMPIGDDYSDVNFNEYIARLDETNGIFEFAINHGSFSSEFDLEEGDPISFQMKEKEGYIDEYMVHHLTKTDNRNDYTSDESFANFRSVNNGNIQEGTLYRGASPSGGDERAKYIDDLIKKAKIVTVINLSDNQDALKKRNLTLCPNYKKLVSKGSVIPLNMDNDFFSQENTAKLKNGLIFMATHKAPYFIHCDEGQDRAGMVIAFLEALTGATTEEIIDDYMESYENFFGLEKGSNKYEILSKNITSFLTELNGGKTVKDKKLEKVAKSYAINVIGLSEKQVDKIIKNLTSK